MRTKSDYETHTKEELLEEAAKRKIEGVSHATLKADIVAALQFSDEPEQDPEPEQPPAPLPPLVASPIPKIVVAPEEVKVEHSTPKDEEYVDGIWTKEGEPYALCVHEPNEAGKTHTLKNSLHFWQGTNEEFKAAFERT